MECSLSFSPFLLAPSPSLSLALALSPSLSLPLPLPLPPSPSLSLSPSLGCRCSAVVKGADSANQEVAGSILAVRARRKSAKKSLQDSPSLYSQGLLPAGPLGSIERCEPTQVGVDQAWTPG